MADNMLEGTFSFEAGFKPATSGFVHSLRYTYGQCVCTRCKREFVLLALSCGTYPSTAAVHGPQSGHVSSHQSLPLWSFLLQFFSERSSRHTYPFGLA